MTNTACITGFGLIDALGSTPDECYRNYMSDQLFTTHMDTNTPINTKYGVRAAPVLPQGVNGLHLSNNSRLALHVVDQACEMAGVQKGSNASVLFTSDIPRDSQDQFYDNYYGGNARRLGPRRLIDSLPGASASLVSSVFNFQGFSDGLNAACATGLASIDYAMRCIDDYDYIIVGAAESPSPATASLFHTLGAISNVSKPFDTTRNGFVLAEGAGCLIIESEEKARKRNAPIYAKIHKPGIAMDKGSDVAPDPHGQGAIAAMRQALLNAGLDDVDAVNAHATSTPVGDVIEYNAVRTLTDAPMYSCKGKIGHLLTSSGINEMIYSILFSQHGHTGYNYQLTSPLENSHNLPTSPIHLDKQSITTMKNSFGFGGRCIALVMEVPNVG
jgi:3-oxoacyl-[acyl-carrier-protein] synthase II